MKKILENYQNLVRNRKKLFYLKKFVHSKIKIMRISLIFDLNLKIKNITFVTKELDSILTLYSYVIFLEERKRQMKYANLRDYTTIDYLKNDINELFRSIKIEAEKLVDLMNMRNLLICIREGVSIKYLPWNFTFFNDN